MHPSIHASIALVACPPTRLAPEEAERGDYFAVDLFPKSSTAEKAAVPRRLTRGAGRVDGGCAVLARGGGDSAKLVYSANYCEGAGAVTTNARLCKFVAEKSNTEAPPPSPLPPPLSCLETSWSSETDPEQTQFRCARPASPSASRWPSRRPVWPSMRLARPYSPPAPSSLLGSRSARGSGCAPRSSLSMRTTR